MNQAVDLSIIIVSYNTKDLLKRCLSSLFISFKESPLRTEVIIIDNGSTDGSQDLIRSLYPQVKLIENARNSGFGNANNQGVAKATAENLLFLNSDTEVLNNAVDKLWSFFIQQKTEVIVGGKLFNPDKTPQPSCGPEYTLPMIFTALFLKGDYRNITRYSPVVIKEVDWVMGACMMMSKATFTRVGGFDEQIFMYMDEIDFEYRAKKQSIKILFYPEAHFIHHGAASSSGREQPILNVFRGFLFFYKKHYGWFKLLLLRLILSGKASLAIILFAILGRFKDCNLYIKALKIALT